MFKLTVEFETLEELREFLISGADDTTVKVEAVPEDILVAPKPTPKNVGRKNKPGGGRPKGTTKGKTRGTPKKPVRIAKTKVETEEVEDFEIEDDDGEVAEPANKEIMDQFDAEQEALIDPDELLDAQEEEQPQTSTVSAKNATKEDVSKVVTELLKRKKDQGKDGVKVAAKILAIYNVKRIRDLNPGHYSNFVQKVQSVM